MFLLRTKKGIHLFRFNTATDEELLAHIEQASAATVSMAKRYYTDKGDMTTVERINVCRAKLKRERMKVKLEKLLSEDQ